MTVKKTIEFKVISRFKQCVIERKIQLVPLSLFLFPTCFKRHITSPRLEAKHPVYFMEYSRCGLHSRNSLNSHNITGPTLLGRAESSGVLRHRGKVGHHEAEPTVSPICYIVNRSFTTIPKPPHNALCTKVYHMCAIVFTYVVNRCGISSPKRCTWLSKLILPTYRFSLLAL